MAASTAATDADASQGRIAARLARLPHDTLAELAASLYCTSATARRTTDDALALHDPTPAWAVERILTSPDLVPHIFVHVEMQDHAGAQVCKAWKRGWDATDAQRRGLRPAELAEPDFEMPRYGSIASLSGDRLCLTSDNGDGTALRIVDANMQTLRVHQIALPARSGLIASEDEIYVFDDRPGLRRFHLDEELGLTQLAEYVDTRDDRYDDFMYSTVSLTQCMLFAVGIIDQYATDEIVSLDAKTLAVTNRFGREIFGEMGAFALAVVGDELYACDSSDRCIRVFSMSGQQLRVIEGGWRMPEFLLFFRDRLYMVERDGPSEFDMHPNNMPEDENPEEKRDRLQAGKRIVVLTPQGKILQKYKIDDEGFDITWMLGFVSDKLLFRLLRYSSGGGGGPFPVRALKGV